MINECTTAYLKPIMDIARIQAYAQNMKDRKRPHQASKEHDQGQHKRAWSIDDMGESRDEFRPSFP